MNSITKIIFRIKFWLYAIASVNWFSFFKKLDKNSKNVIWLYPIFPNKIWAYFRMASFENDLALVNTVVNNCDSFTLKIGVIDSQIKDKCIFYNVSTLFDKEESLESYNRAMLNKIGVFVKNNKVIPEMKHVEYWENKIFMHEMFNKLNIPHPKTRIVNEKNPAPSSESLEYPILFKPAHACGSMGIKKINNQKEYDRIIAETSYKEYLLQEWIDMRKDIRLIYIGDELVVHYWRINNAKDWVPTSTGRGSSVDFDTLPTQWMDFIFQQYKKLNLKSGAFDITWRNDDLSTTPLILEVSPSFMPNPAPTNKYKDRSYNEFKKSIWGKNAYHRKYIDLVFKLKHKLIKEYDIYRHTS